MATKRTRIRRGNRRMVPTQVLARHFIDTSKRRRARYMCRLERVQKRNDGIPRRHIIAMENILYDVYWVYMKDEPELEARMRTDKRYKKLLRR